MNLNQGFPNVSAPFVEKGGNISRPWYQLLVTLWNRTGGAQDNGTGASSGFKPGDIKMQGHPNVGAGFLACDGTLVDKTTWAALYAAIGDTWNIGGEGATVFRLPNAINKFPVGGGSSYAVGGYGGAATQTLTEANLAPHSHEITDPGHAHNFTADPHTHLADLPTGPAGAGNGPVAPGDDSGTSDVTVALSTVTGVVDPNVTGIAGTEDAGSGAPFNLIPPFFGVYYAIKT